MTRLHTAVLIGNQLQVVVIEVKATRGIPKLIISGLPDQVIREAKDRILTAIKSAGFKFKSCRTVVNLAPASLKKTGSGLDLGIALGVLLEQKQIEFQAQPKQLFVGELGLSGEIKPIPRIFALISKAAKAGFSRFYLPDHNLQILDLIDHVDLYPVKNLVEFSTAPFPPIISTHKISQKRGQNSSAKQFVSLAAIPHQQQAKRAVAIAVAGGHHLLLVGSPGSGKKRLVLSLASILPDPTRQQLRAINEVYSLSQQPTTLLNLPLRIVDQTVSLNRLFGGGSRLLPGEVSLAHEGVLVLNNITQFRQKLIKPLQLVLEAGQARLSYSSRQTQYPARFTLMAMAEPCPCGYAGNLNQRCQCNPDQKRRHWQKIPPGLMAKFDLVCRVQSSQENSLKLLLANKDQKVDKKSSHSDLLLQQQIQKAWEIQDKRFLTKSNIRRNFQIQSEELERYIRLKKQTKSVLMESVEVLNLPYQLAGQILKVGQTIADLDQSSEIQPQHITEALAFRNNLIY